MKTIAKDLAGKHKHLQMTNRSLGKERVKCLCSQMSGHLLFIVYVERSTDVAANEREREERETPDVL